MQIYLVRHAHAIDGEDDDARPLSAKGRKQIRRVAAFLRWNEMLGTREFWHSPAVRAQDTAERFAARLKIRAKLVEVTGIRNEDNPAMVARRLKTLRRPVALFGHEPHLSALASVLIAGRAEPALFVLPKCAVVCLERAQGHWAVAWQVTPKLLR
jgi:phosphohistidine phosphatase